MTTPNILPNPSVLKNKLIQSVPITKEVSLEPTQDINQPDIPTTVTTNIDNIKGTLSSFLGQVEKQKQNVANMKKKQLDIINTKYSIKESKDRQLDKVSASNTTLSKRLLAEKDSLNQNFTTSG
jgi:hypothetical protein